MTKHRFIQISSSVSENSEALYALDAEGQVWYYNFDSRYWENLPTKRYTST